MENGNKILNIDRSWERWLRICAYIAAIVGVILALLTLICDIRPRIVTVESGIERVEKGILSNQFSIINPKESDIVGLTDLIRGKTPFSEMNHYIVVTPLKVGGDWVQDGYVTVSPGGIWTGRAKFGDAGVGAGERFIVRGLATETSLSPGPLDEVPNDAVFSEPITVTRKE